MIETEEQFREAVKQCLALEARALTTGLTLAEANQLIAIEKQLNESPFDIADDGKVVRKQ